MSVFWAVVWGVTATASLVIAMVEGIFGGPDAHLWFVTSGVCLALSQINFLKADAEEKP